jgi:hypothetical protein
MKSTKAWLDLGDENIKLFHHFTNNKTCINTIWKMKYYEDHNVRGFKILVCLGVQHISKIYFVYTTSIDDQNINNINPFPI